MLAPTRRLLATTASAVLLIGLAACGSDEAARDDRGPDTTEAPTTEAPTTEAPTTEPTTSTTAPNVEAGTVRCETFSGSFDIDPGVTQVPADQQIEGRGRLTDCRTADGDAPDGQLLFAGIAPDAVATPQAAGTVIGTFTGTIDWTDETTSVVSLTLKQGDLAGGEPPLVFETTVTDGPYRSDRVAVTAVQVTDVEMLPSGDGMASESFSSEPIVLG